MYDGTVGVLGDTRSPPAASATPASILRRSIGSSSSPRKSPPASASAASASRLYLSSTLDPNHADDLREANEPADTAQTLASIREAAGFQAPLTSTLFSPETTTTPSSSFTFERVPLSRNRGGNPPRHRHQHRRPCQLSLRHHWPRGPRRSPPHARPPRRPLRCLRTHHLSIKRHALRPPTPSTPWPP